MKVLSLVDLPDALIRHILTFIPDAVTVCRLQATCHDLYHAVVQNDQALWEGLYRHRWTYISSSPPPLNKAEYQRRHEVDRQARKQMQVLMTRKKCQQHEKALRLLMATGREAIDVAWKLHDDENSNNNNNNNNSHDPIKQRLLSNQLILLLQRVCVYEDMLTLRKNQTCQELERLEGYAVLSSLLFAQTSFRNFDQQAQLIRQQLDEIANDIKRRLVSATTTTAAAAATEQKVQIMNHVLFEQEDAFVGNTENYYDYHNSLLSSCLERKKGIPLTLAILYKIIGHRVGINVNIIGLPGHIVVGFDDDNHNNNNNANNNNNTYVDVFNQGRILDHNAIVSIVNSYGFAFQPEFLRPLSPEDVLKRVCNNLANCLFQVVPNDNDNNNDDGAATTHFHVSSSEQQQQQLLMAGLMKRLLYNPSSQLLETCHAELCQLWISERELQ